MLNIKKYANGRFFDTVNKKYIKQEQLTDLIKKGKKMKVTLAKTGKDITASVIDQFSKKEAPKKGKKGAKASKKDVPLLKPDKLVKWLGDVVDEKVDKVLDMVKLPSKQQVAQLNKNIKALNKKIDELKLAQEKAVKKKTAKPAAK
jgi:polyhydroxyalkanoate synthesis regulator protein